MKISSMKEHTLRGSLNSVEPERRVKGDLVEFCFHQLIGSSSSVFTYSRKYAETSDSSCFSEGPSIRKSSMRWDLAFGCKHFPWFPYLEQEVKRVSKILRQIQIQDCWWQFFFAVWTDVTNVRSLCRWLSRQEKTGTVDAVSKWSGWKRDWSSLAIACLIFEPPIELSDPQRWFLMIGTPIHFLLTACKHHFSW